MAASTRSKRLSVQVVPGPDHDDDDDADPPENPEKVKSKEANLNVVNAGSEASPPRTPRALKATQSETKNDISTLISRKSFANVQFHRYSVFASLFDLRAAVPADEVSKLLDRHGKYKYDDAAPDEDEPRIRRCLHCLVATIRATARQEVRMHPLCFLSLLIGPFMLSFETTCSEVERPMVLAAKIIHLVSTVAYLFFAAAHFLYSPLNPWPEILKQRRKRFKLLSHKAEVLHPALVQQLHARGGPEEETNHEATKNPLTSLRFWVPIFDGLVLLGFVAEIVNMTKRPSRIEGWSHWAWILVTARGFRLVVPPSDIVVSNFWTDTLVLGMWLFVVIHLCSCLLSVVSVLEVQNGNVQAWAAEQLLDSGGSSCRRFYMYSWYYTSTTVTSIGYGDISPQNPDERLVASAVMILSQLYFAKVFADLTFLTSMYNQWTLQRHQRMTQTRSALESMNIPKTLIQRVQACQTYVWDMQKERRAKNCFEDLTSQLQEEVKLVLYSRLVMQVPFLQTLDARALRFLIGRLSDQVFLPADFIICRGDIGNEMYFLREGFAGVFTCQRAPHWEDDEIKKVEKGSHFGEIALLTGQLRTAWIMARAYCLTSVLQASAIDNLMAQDPTSICTLIKNFQDMLKLKPSLSWSDIKTRLDREFDPDDPCRHDLYDFVCSGDDGLAPAGIITWTRYQVLLSRIQVSQLDQKLLWAELDEEQSGAVTFYNFVLTVYLKAPEESDPEDDDDPFRPSASRPMGSTSLRSSKSAKSLRPGGSSGEIIRKDSTCSQHSSRSKMPLQFRSRSMYYRNKKKGAASDVDSAMLNRLMVLEDKIDVLLNSLPGGHSMVLDSQRLHSGRPSVEVTPPPMEVLLS